MKNKKKIIALSGAILAIAATIGIGTWIGSSKNENDIAVSDEEQVESSSTEELPLVSEDGVNLTLTEENFDEIKSFMSEFQIGAIVKEIDDVTFDSSGLIVDNVCLERIEYKMNNLTNTNTAFDTLAIYNDENLKEDYSNWNEIVNKHIVNIEEYFNKNILNAKNVFDLIFIVMNNYGIDESSFINARLDKKNYDGIYEEYKQKHYYCDIYDDFDLSLIKLNDNDYDEIISKDLIIATNLSETNDEFFSFITMRVEYMKNDTLHNRNLIFTIRYLDDIEKEAE